MFQWAKGESALINSKPCPQNPKLRIAADIEQQILHLRKTYYLALKGKTPYEVLREKLVSK